MNNNYIQNTNETFGGISKKFLARLVAIIIEKISDRTLTVENDLLKISGPNNVIIKNKGIAVITMPLCKVNKTNKNGNRKKIILFLL